MKGKLIPHSQTLMVYTDVNDQDWHVALDLTKGNIAAGLDDAANMYGRKTSDVLVRSDSFEHAAEAIDQWVDDWNAGKNPAPVLTVSSSASKGNMWPLLLLGAFLLLSKGKRK